MLGVSAPAPSPRGGVMTALAEPVSLSNFGRFAGVTASAEAADGSADVFTVIVCLACFVAGGAESLVEPWASPSVRLPSWLLARRRSEGGGDVTPGICEDTELWLTVSLCCR